MSLAHFSLRQRPIKARASRQKEQGRGKGLINRRMGSDDLLITQLLFLKKMLLLQLGLEQEL